MFIPRGGSADAPLRRPRLGGGELGAPPRTAGERLRLTLLNGLQKPPLRAQPINDGTDDGSFEHDVLQVVYVLLKALSYFAQCNRRALDAFIRRYPQALVRLVGAGGTELADFLAE